MKDKIIKIVYASIMGTLFIAACVIGYMCMQYDRFPEGLVIVGSAFIIMLVSIILLVTQKGADEKIVQAKAGPILSKIQGTVSLMDINGNVDIEENGVVEFHKYGIVIVAPSITYDLVPYDDVEDIYKEEDLDLFICVKDWMLKAVGTSKVKFMAAEDILNKQTNYRFNDDSDDE